MHKVTKASLGVLSLIALTLSAPGFAQEGSTDAELNPKRAVIHFADLGGIKNWRAVGDDAIDIQGRNGDWYHAELWTYCQGLRSANSISFLTEPNGDLDRYSAIYVGHGERCQFRTFERIEAPTDSQD